MFTQVQLPTIRKARNAKMIGKLIGSGSFRQVYRTRNARWAYKFDIGTPRDRGSNFTEYKTYLAIRDSDKLPVGVKVPEMHLLEDNVLATEYIKGTHPYNWCTPGYHTSVCPGIVECWVSRFKRPPIRDIHSNNVILTKSGDLYLIDLGNGLS